MKRLIFVLIIMSGCCKTQEDKLREQLNADMAKEQIRMIINEDSVKNNPEQPF